jgi:hypothetical protein
MHDCTESLPVSSVNTTASIFPWFPLNIDVWIKSHKRSFNSIMSTSFRRKTWRRISSEKSKFHIESGSAVWPRARASSLRMGAFNTMLCFLTRDEGTTSIVHHLMRFFRNLLTHLGHHHFRKFESNVFIF